MNSASRLAKGPDLAGPRNSVGKVAARHHAAVVEDQDARCTPSSPRPCSASRRRPRRPARRAGAPGRAGKPRSAGRRRPSARRAAARRASAASRSRCSIAGALLRSSGATLLVGKLVQHAGGDDPRRRCARELRAAGSRACEAKKLQVLVAGELRIEGVLLRAPRRSPSGGGSPTQLTDPACGVRKPDQQIDQRRLAGPVRPQQAHGLRRVKAAG